ncbi:hypothetical protein CDAR_51861 [Caerostris darwini]|uniref:Uncharacterized protein n=1 Tax=Caerostris darwini TaxID=1538125 RepID=A0AAV4NPG0_9ARAC|nr:hypothetical protein CDAR_51861 [Caerostris darwini]
MRRGASGYRRGEIRSRAAPGRTRRPKRGSKCRAAPGRTLGQNTGNQIPTPDLSNSVSGCAPAQPYPIFPSSVSMGAPRRSPTPDFQYSVSGCAPAQPYTCFHSSVSGCAPAQPLHLIFPLFPGGAPAPYPDFPLFCLWVRPGAALYT